MGYFIFSLSPIIFYYFYWEERHYEDENIVLREAYSGVMGSGPFLPNVYSKHYFLFLTKETDAREVCKEYNYHMDSVAVDKHDNTYDILYYFREYPEGNIIYCSVKYYQE